MNRNFIIGTAGHIDHGKTSLIRALTGIETDRFEEEKKRGITIDLGFAYFDLPSGIRAGIIDVPGHEKFIKNMLAGISGVDLFLLVIAADEGVMPQTKEHLDILEILGIEEGIIVITKADLVDEEMLELVQDDIRENFGSSFLEKSEIVTFSAKTGDGLDNLIEKLDEKSKVIKTKNSKGPFRMSVDRVFSLSGHGTIVTGTLVEGEISVGDKVSIYPEGRSSKVRSIQVHGKSEEIAYAGQRTAINLPDIKTSEIHRGDVLASEDSISPAYIVDCKLKLTRDSNRSIENWTRLRLYHGAKEILCRCVLLDREVLKAGEEDFVQLRLEEPYSFKYNDKFVVRFYSPVETIGGGVILNPDSNKHKRFDESVIKELELKTKGDPRDILVSMLENSANLFTEKKEILSLMGIEEDDFEDIVGKLIDDKMVYSYKGLDYMFFENLEKVEGDILSMLNTFYDKNPYKLGINKGEVRSSLAKKYDFKSNKHFDYIISLLIDLNNIELEDQYVKHAGHEVTFSEGLQKRVDKALDDLKKQEFKTEAFADILKIQGITKHQNDITDILIRKGQITRVADNIFFDSSLLDQLQEKVKEHFKSNDFLEINDIKEMTGTSRKYIIPILEYFDKIKLTKREDGKRVQVK
jgi:selenocysteine-specific elongation factor